MRTCRRLDPRSVPRTTCESTPWTDEWIADGAVAVLLDEPLHLMDEEDAMDRWLDLNA